MFRQLFFECFTMVQQELRLRLERTSDDVVVRKLAVPERAARFRAQENRLQGLVLRGELECSDALVDLCVSQYDSNRVAYISWQKCLSKSAEEAGIKKDPSIGQNLAGLLKLGETVRLPDADTSTELLLKYALTRRALAYDQALLVTFGVSMVWVERLFAVRLRPALTHHQKVTIEQLELADRAVFLRAGELTRDGVVPNAAGNRPLDTALVQAWLEPEIAQLLAQMAQSSGSKSLTASKRPAGDGEVPTLSKRAKKKAAAAAKAVVKAKPAPPRPPSGDAKGNKGKGRGNLPGGLEGSSRTPDGMAICYGYNLRNCTSSGASCARGKHCCCRCFGNHPFPGAGIACAGA
jgi:hypothetical protein